MMKNFRIKPWIKKHPKWSVFICLLLVWRIAGHYPWFYMVGPIEGYVVDKESGKPVVGAIAVQQFTVQKPKLHGTKDKVIYIAESVTDEKGRYSFQKWGPVFNSFRYRPRSEHVPGISVFKQGYRVAGMFNANGGAKRFQIDFVASKNPVVLEKFESLDVELKLYMKHRSLLAWRVGSGMECVWQKIPNFMIENDKRYRLYERHLPLEYRYYLPRFLDEWEGRQAYGCLEPKIIFKEYLNGLLEKEKDK